MTAPDCEAGVVVIGAGVAGLAAAGHLRAAGIPTTLIEAGARIGGRAWTTQVGPDPFDHGATWLHDADRNPLVGLATAEDDLVDTDAQRRERLTLSGRPATPDEAAACDAAWADLDTISPGSPDTTLAAALPPTPWTPLLALWEGPIIAAADAARLGLRDWHRNRLEGRNLAPRAGVGAFVARRLATPAALGTPATRLDWSGPGVRVETPNGTIRASAAIVTVSTGVLAAGSIRFYPALPARTQAAIHALPMGLLAKIALPVAPGLDLPQGTVLVDRDGCMTFNVRPLGRAYLAGFAGGDLAWSLAKDPGAFEDLARSELRRTLGADALRHVAPAAVVTGWGTDPGFAGSYAYQGPESLDGGNARAGLAQPPADHLLFAGEALRSDGLAGTVAGAWLSGTEAAETWMASRRS